MHVYVKIAIVLVMTMMVIQTTEGGVFWSGLGNIFGRILKPRPAVTRQASSQSLSTTVTSSSNTLTNSNVMLNTKPTKTQSLPTSSNKQILPTAGNSVGSKSGLSSSDTGNLASQRKSWYEPPQGGTYDINKFIPKSQYSNIRNIPGSGGATSAVSNPSGAVPSPGPSAGVGTQVTQQIGQGARRTVTDAIKNGIKRTSTPKGSRFRRSLFICA